jgi:hypothetical protein
MYVPADCAFHIVIDYLLKLVDHGIPLIYRWLFIRGIRFLVIWVLASIKFDFDLVEVIGEDGLTLGRIGKVSVFRSFTVEFSIFDFRKLGPQFHVVSPVGERWFIHHR